MIRCDNTTDNKNKIYALIIKFGDGEWYVYKSKSKKRLIKYRDNLIEHGKSSFASYARVRRRRIKLMTEEELRKI